MAEPTAEPSSSVHPLFQLLKDKGYYDKPFTIVFKVTIKAGKEAEMLEAIRKQVPLSLSEEGCTTFTFYQDIKDPTVFILLETWKDGPSLDVHFQHQYTKDFMAVLKDIATATDSNVVTPVSV